MSDNLQPMTCGPQKRKRGRPRKHVDLDMVERLAAIQCTHVEIASTLGVSVDTLTRDRRFAEIYKRGAESGRKSLRRMQFESALKGNVTMMIWLGKQYLGQSDQGRIEVQQLPTLDELSLPQLARLLGSMNAKDLRQIVEQLGGRVPQEKEEASTIDHVPLLPSGYKN